MRGYLFYVYSALNDPNVSIILIFPAFNLQQPQIILLKEGTDTSQGKQQVISNINACQIVVDAVRTTLGPRGMDKLIVDQNGKSTISNDGATILKLLDIIHPAAKTLVDIAKSQDAEVRTVLLHSSMSLKTSSGWHVSQHARSKNNATRILYLQEFREY